jgi:anaerobic ribonucleoside-triphosphate reductase activating protein
MMLNKRSLNKDFRIRMEINLRIRIAGMVAESVVDGPGLRYVIFTQGCPHHCPGCHNPQTHDFTGGYEISIDEILAALSKVKLIEGITLSGGEPFAQAAACAQLARAVKKLGLTVVTYSGYYYAELQQQAIKDPAITELLAVTDVLIDGPYDETQKDLNLPFRGSRNQSIINLA